MKVVVWSIGIMALLVAGPVGANAGVSQNATVASTDKSLDDRIEQRLDTDASLKKYDIDVSVDAGVATLTGTVATDKQKARAARLATVRGITRVNNQIAVDPSADTKGTMGTIGDKTKQGAEKVVDKTKEGAEKVFDKTKEGAETVADKTKDGAEIVADKTKEGLSKAGEEITDAWIITRVKSRFVGEDLLKDSDINVDASNQVVTLKGTVMSAAGRDRAMAIAKDTEGVRTVVDRLTIGPER